jgi:hypothetical protein
MQVQTTATSLQALRPENIKQNEQTFNFLKQGVSWRRLNTFIITKIWILLYVGFYILHFISSIVE